ncbi:MAG: hypothetical protein L6V85_10115 [Clostridiales bacterium]|nr:MAG: hypothetical protein L6V85_10115 [Clostridiales bacterium]
MQYPRIVENEVGKRNCTIENAAISLLSTYTARDMTRTMNEVNKLCAFKDGGKITKDDVEKPCRCRYRIQDVRACRRIVARR